jgi:hypothetical protein
VCIFTRREELAKDVLNAEVVLYVASCDGGESFIEQRHAFLDAVVVDHRGAEVGERFELERVVAESPAGLEGFAQMSFLRLAVRLEHPHR